MSWQFPYFNNGHLDWDTLYSQFDWVRDMEQTPQDAEWHGEGNVYIHTRMVVDELLQLPQFKDLPTEAQHILVASALLHDIEKRSTTTTEIIDGRERIVSPNHARRGEMTTRSLLYRELPTPFHIREHIAKLVRLHGLPLWAISKGDPAKTVISASLEVDTQLLAMLARADVLGRIAPDQEELLLNIDLFEELCKDHHCFGQPRAFGSDYARYHYLNRSDASPDYVPYEDHEFEVIVLSGLPGTGKDTYIHQHLKDLPMLSLDQIRRDHNIEPYDKKGNGQVIQLGKEQAKIWLRARTPFVFNATNITRDLRGKWISLFTEYRARVRIIYLEVPYQQLLHQNHNRDHKVPKAVVDRLVGKLEVPGYMEAHEVEYIAASNK